MRIRRDRLRHTILYEALLLALLIPLCSSVLHESASKIGALGIFLSLLAMTWNYVYNLGFDKTLRSLGRPLYPRGFRLRALHAVLFEGSLLFVSIPAMMWWLHLSLWQAVVMNLTFLLLVPVYTLGYNWLYDLFFPPMLLPKKPA
ncbi:MAG: PACE efflux transporter [Desulfuromonas sp.]|nr:PACE efflux transporter [Desulfuromonas sp.]